ncbi:MAG: hypothetical protein KF729_06255 [Sandaracinaceae bacterium]|nr:hypothetical protein [Sandaracinaceae bacterium]
MRAASRFAVILLGSAGSLALGCRATIPDDTFACTTDEQCPDGFRCAGGFCNRTPGVMDAGGVDAALDAGPALDADPFDGGEADGAPRDASADAGSHADGGGTERSMAECSDGVDNDDDGRTDCADPECCDSGACTAGVLACECPAIGDRTVIDVRGTVPAGTEWACDHLYHLEGVVNVEGGDLTVHPGTLVRAGRGAGLFIERDARLLALGTAARPIHFTSAEPEGARAPGDWHGLFVFGQAPINDPSGSSVIPGFPADIVAYGGTDPTHDCGRIEYVNITFGGQDQNVNLALIACGTRTEVHYVHTAHSADTNVYVGGGTVTMDHVTSWASRDEGFLYSEGWVGSAQFLFVGAAGGAGIRGRTSFVDAGRLPYSTPAIWNATVTNSVVAGVELLSGGGIHMGNSIVAGVMGGGACFAPDATSAPRIPADLDLRHSILWSCGGTMGLGSGAGALGDAGVYANRFVDPVLNVGTPPPGSPATTGATTPPAGLDATTYLGAFTPAPAGTNDWSDGWADYRPN